MPTDRKIYAGDGRKQRNPNRSVRIMKIEKNCQVAVLLAAIVA